MTYGVLSPDRARGLLLAAVPVAVPGRLRLRRPREPVRGRARVVGSGWASRRRGRKRAWSRTLSPPSGDALDSGDVRRPASRARRPARRGRWRARSGSRRGGRCGSPSARAPSSDELRLLALALPRQPRLRVRRRLVRLVAFASRRGSSRSGCPGSSGGGRSSGFSSFGRKLFIEAHASISVPSTVKCSLLIRPRTAAPAPRPPRRTRLATSCSSSRSRFCENVRVVEASARPCPCRGRYPRLFSNTVTPRSSRPHLGEPEPLPERLRARRSRRRPSSRSAREAGPRELRPRARPSSPCRSRAPGTPRGRGGGRCARSRAPGGRGGGRGPRPRARRRAARARRRAAGRPPRRPRASCAAASAAGGRPRCARSSRARRRSRPGSGAGVAVRGPRERTVEVEPWALEARHQGARRSEGAHARPSPVAQRRPRRRAKRRAGALSRGGMRRAARVGERRRRRGRRRSRQLVDAVPPGRDRRGPGQPTCWAAATSRGVSPTTSASRGASGAAEPRARPAASAAATIRSRASPSSREPADRVRRPTRRSGRARRGRASARAPLATFPCRGRTGAPRAGERLEQRVDAGQHRVARAADLRRAGARGSARGRASQAASSKARPSSASASRTMSRSVMPSSRRRRARRRRRAGAAALARARARWRGARRRPRARACRRCRTGRPRRQDSLRTAPPRTRRARTASGPRRVSPTPT